jgi:triosephosphate isomerase
VDQFSESPLVNALKSPVVLFTLLVAGVTVAAFIAFRIAGPLGMGVLGLLIAFIAQRIKLEKDGAFGGGMNASLAAMQMRVREQMTHAERSAHTHETRSLLQATSLATTIGLALAVVGIGAWFLG